MIKIAKTDKRLGKNLVFYQNLLSYDKTSMVQLIIYEKSKFHNIFVLGPIFFPPGKFFSLSANFRCRNNGLSAEILES